MVVEEMNRLGMVVDMAQLNDEGFWDVMEMTSKPVADSHTNAFALCDNPRNVSDERIRATGENGGLIGVTFVKGEVKRWSTETGEVATFDDVAERLDYMVDLVGIDHAAIGDDLDDWELVDNVHRCWSPVLGLIENHIGVPAGSNLIDSRTPSATPTTTSVRSSAPTGCGCTGKCPVDSPAGSPRRGRSRARNRNDPARSPKYLFRGLNFYVALR